MPVPNAKNNNQKYLIQKALPAIFIPIIAVLLCSGYTIAQTPDPYLQLLKENAKNGSATEQYILGRKYILGNGTVKDLSKGLQWLKKAAKNNYTPASLYLGKIYEQGIGFEQNFLEAVQWYKKAAGQGSESASMKIAPLTDKDPDQEFILYGNSLQKANKLSIRCALQKKGAEFLPQKGSSLCDQFNTNKLMPGSDLVQACYTSKNKLAHLEFRFPPTRPQNTLQRIHSKFLDKYGEPENSQAGSLYIWNFKGVKINFRYNPKYRTAFLRYSLPERQKQFIKQLQEKESNSTKQSYNP